MLDGMHDDHCIAERYSLLASSLDERQRRLLVAAEAKAIGRGGIAVVSDATGVSRQTICLGLTELSKLSAGEENSNNSSVRIRKPGGGRKKAVDHDNSLLADLERFVDPVNRGNFESPLRWTCKSLRRLASELKASGHNVSHVMVGALLKANNYRLQAHAKMIEGGEQPDRNEKFEQINALAARALAAGEPVIHVVTKKKEVVSRVEVDGRERKKLGNLFDANCLDLFDPESGHATTYGAYDSGADYDWVSVGTDRDTHAFAAESIRRWWLGMGTLQYPKATELTITTDGGSNNSDHVGLWKHELQKFVNKTGILVRVCHFPSGTSKWSKVDHRYFSFTGINLWEQPLVSHEVIVNLLAKKRRRSGLDGKAEQDCNVCPNGFIDAKEDFTNARITFSGEWTYRIKPSYRALAPYFLTSL